MVLSLHTFTKVVIVATSNPGIDHASIFKNHISGVWELIIWQAVFMIMTVGIIAAGAVKGIQRWLSGFTFAFLRA